MNGECLQGGFDVGNVPLHLVQAALVLVAILALLDAVRDPLPFELARGADPFLLG